jgi:hypothetical protein
MKEEQEKRLSLKKIPTKPSIMINTSKQNEIEKVL